MGKVMRNIIQGRATLALLFILLGTLFCLPSPAAAAITRVQSATGAVGTAAATSFSVTLGAAPTNGNTLVAIISTRGTTASRVTGISQTGATWTKIVEGTNATGSTTEIWYAPNVSGAATGITINQASLFSAAVVMEYSGILTASPVDKSISSTGTSTAASTGTTTATAQASEVAVGGIGLVSSGYTIGTPTNSFTAVANIASGSATATSNAKSYALEKMLSATGTVTTGGTVSTSSAWSGALATLKEAPPAAGTVSATPYANGYISSSPTITASFASTWAISTCEYTTNGSTWSAGTVSGSAPSFTCTANPTGLSGALTINMRATSTYTGTGTGTAISRTVDATPPVDGTLAIYPGNPRNGLIWTAASDTGIGFDHYDLYFQTGAVPPACGGGTLLYTGKWLTYSHTGLSASTTYSYRVCATDKGGNVSAGASGTVTTTVRASVVNTCSSCHGYPPVDNAARVGGATGQFPGSHNKHTGSGSGQYSFACTNCHVNNTAFNHATGTINMASPLHGDTGASYSRGTAPAVDNNNITYGTCSNTYCHSDGTSVATGTVAANTSPAWGGTTACSTCHGAPPQYRSGVPKMNSHTSAQGHKFAIGTLNPLTCDNCHSSVTYSGGTYTPDVTLHNSGSYNLKASLGYTFATTGGTCATPGNGCHGSTPGTWGGSLGCVDCHSKAITRTQGRPGTTLAAVTTEFGLAYGHKKSGRGALQNADCVVCHLEGYGYGNAHAGKPNPTYHRNGNIDLRDPLGSGETPITNISGTAFTFQRFSTSYAAGSRTSTGHTSNTDIANVITQKFCLACHSSTGATNPTARSNNGGTGTATMPFGGVNLGANYTVANGAAIAGGLIDVNTQMATTNSSYHPVRGPLNKDFPTPARLNPPYNNFARAGTSGTKTLGVVMNCFDCHNNNTGTLLTLRTISAHGTNNTAQVRGTFYLNTPSLCIACHAGYTASSSNHGTGSALLTASLDGGENITTGCQNCHGSSTRDNNSAATIPARPIPAADFHGYNALLGGTLWPTINARPYGFIRNAANYVYHRPFRGTETALLSGSAGCSGGSGKCANNSQAGPAAYTPGGSY